MLLCSSLCVACADASDEGEMVEGQPAALDGGDVPDPSQVSITAAAYGCGTMNTQVGALNTEYALTFDDARGGRDDFGTYDVACDVEITYTYPAGYTFDAPSLDVFGDVYTEDAAVVTVQASRSLAGTASVSKTFENIDTDVEGVFELLSIPAGGQAGSAPCGATSATVNVQLRATIGGTGRAAVKFNYIDGLIPWRRCQ
ncbi:DUF4360 domain-containing protein [Sorangium cellulosum]|uniref:Uncharacterized protein n=1 Tax=Sorangium cellulosum So0157-2 TaxID=1254432 RepID=S4Y8F3_SORCE|nr:DUF4360 domain-containing protein [Sorangium cellulosum]AGP41747.1 hypothetical protein SCE1572_49035 [Sorangium cellulosum So0157-2]